MATWKKIIVSGSQAHLAAVTASLGIVVGTSGPNQTIGTTQGTTQLTGSFTGSFTGVFNGTITSATSASYVNVVQDSTNATRYLTFVDSDNTAPGLYEELKTDAGITYNPSNDTLTLSGDLAVNGGDITTTSTTFNLLAGATSTLTVGAASTTSSFGGQVIVTGDLTVNGDTTFINTTNLLVEDQFVLFGSGSIANKDGGIVIQSSTGANQGYGFIYDTDTDRWYMQDGASATTGLGAISYTTTAGVVSVQRDTVANKPADGTGPLYGGSANGWGNMYIESDGDNDIWIYV